MVAGVLTESAWVMRGWGECMRGGCMRGGRAFFSGRTVGGRAREYKAGWGCVRCSDDKHRASWRHFARPSGGAGVGGE